MDATQIKEYEEEIAGIDDQIRKLNEERSKLIAKITDLKWKEVPVCEFSYYQVREGKCKHGDVHRGSIFCKHRFCKQ